MASYYTRESLRELYNQEINEKLFQEIDIIVSNIKKEVIRNAKLGEKEIIFEYTPSSILLSHSPEIEIQSRLNHIFLDLDVYLYSHDTKQNCYIFDIRWGIE